MSKTLRTRILSTTAFIILLAGTLSLSGCFSNPTTGRVGPSWQVPFKIPLASSNATLEELLGDTDTSYRKDGVLQAETSIKESIGLDDVEFDIKPVKIDIGEGDYEIPTGGPVFTLTTKLDLSSARPGEDLESIKFGGGLLSLGLDPDSQVTLTSVSIGEAKSLGNSSVSLAGVTLRENDDIRIEGTITGSEPNIKSITLTFDTLPNDIITISGRDIELKIPTQTISLDLPDEFKHIELQNVDLAVYLTGVNAASFDLSGLKIGNLKQVSASDSGPFGGQELHFDPKDTAKLINKHLKNPSDEIEIKGLITVGADFPAAVNLKEELGLELKFTVPLEFDVKDEIVFESDPIRITKGKISDNELLDVTNKLTGLIDVDHRLPLGVEIELHISSQKAPFNDANALKITASIPAAPTDHKGRTQAAYNKVVPFKVPEELRDVLSKEAYGQMKMTIPQPQSGGAVFTSLDYVNAKAWVELQVDVNK